MYAERYAILNTSNTGELIYNRSIKCKRRIFVKDTVLEELRENSAEYLSGEELSKKLGVSRTSIWKHIKKLKEEGYIIESSTKVGYKLIGAPDILYPKEIERLIDTEIIGRKIIFFESIDSTNNYAKMIAADSFIEGMLIVAEEQTLGKGRMGRGWISPKGKGIWVSIMLKPDMKPEQAMQITIIASYAVAKAIKEVSNLEALIKWPNDIVVNGKKVCGILTEMGAEMDAINYLIVGIGINTNIDKTSFTQRGLNTATSLKIEAGENIDRKLLLSEIIMNFEKLYLDLAKNLDITNIINNYKKLSVTLGKDVRIIYNNEEQLGFAKDINNSGQLVVILENGEEIEIVSGEVSVRGIYGYV